MHVTWHGQYTVRLQTTGHTIVLDPYSPAVGLGKLHLKTDIVALSNSTDTDMSDRSTLQSTRAVIDSPGEYAFSDISLQAIGWRPAIGMPQRCLFLWRIESFCLLHIGALNRKLNSEEESLLQKHNVEVLFLPIGGGSGPTCSQAIDLLKTVEPRIVIPIHYHLTHITEKLDTINHFISEIGEQHVIKQTRLSLKRSMMTEEKTTVVILTT